MIKIYNSLTKKIEEFHPLSPPKVGMYTCGPTVYSYAHIGNFRTYTATDILVRLLQYNHYEVKYVMNITDVGHLTGDNMGDADTGEDRLEKAAKKENKTAWDIAQFYTDAFLRDYKRLNLSVPFIFSKATDNIKEQIALVMDLEKKGYTYRTSDGIYFDTTKFKDYGQLSNLDQIKEGARVEPNREKKNPRDFALWKFSPSGEKRQMEWKSPWSEHGFPGWHIECSAMSMKYLGESFDIHGGGMDLASIHHQNEIAQSEAATGKRFSTYWVHVAFMLVNGERMSKSLGNSYTIEDLVTKGFDPISLRYLYLQTHYRQEMNFTFDALTAAQHALKRLRQEVSTWDSPNGNVIEDIVKKFNAAIENDLNTAEVLAIIWELVKSEYPSSQKAETLFLIDTVLGLKLKESKELFHRDSAVIPDQIMKLIAKRDQLRNEKKFHLADEIRNQIKELGYDVIDQGEKSVAKKI